MKIAQITCVYPPHLGGIGQVAFEYAKRLSERHQVTVFTPRYFPEQRVVDLPGVKVNLLDPKFKLGNGALVPQIYDLVRNFDVVHLHYPFFGAQEYFAFGDKIKLVATYHMVPNPSGLKSLLAGADAFISERKLLSKVNTWLVSSEDYLKYQVRPRLGKAAHLETLPFGVDEKFMVTNFGNKIAGLNLKDNLPTILFVGGLDQAHYFKGVDVLLSAVAKIRNKNWQLLIVGEGDLKPRYQQQAAQLNISDQVHFAGRLSDEDLVRAYNLSQLFVLPSLNEAEAFGIVALEAMACGLPVVASYLTGVRSLIKTGENGILVNPGDVDDLAQAMSFIVTQPSLGKKMGECGRFMVDNQYRWPKIITRLEAIYEKL